MVKRVLIAILIVLLGVGLMKAVVGLKGRETLLGYATSIRR